MMSIALNEKDQTTDLEKQRQDVLQQEFCLMYFYQGFFNEDERNLLDLGMGQGPLVLPLLSQGWKLTGYENSLQSLQYLNLCFNPEITTGALTVKNKDLNQLDEELNADIHRYRNITMINVAPFLENASLVNLLFTMMEKAQSGTVFFFCCAYRPKLQDLEKSREMFALPKNYIASFFGPRTNIQFLCHEYTNDFENLYNDVLIVKKL